MMRFQTQSGSWYEVDTAEQKVRRLEGTQNPTPRQGKDGEWKNYLGVFGLEVGSECIFVWDRSNTLLLEGSPESATPTTITSPIVEIMNDTLQN